jgi:hypothetical protein
MFAHQVAQVLLGYPKAFGLDLEWPCGDRVRVWHQGQSFIASASSPSI